MKIDSIASDIYYHQAVDDVSVDKVNGSEYRVTIKMNGTYEYRLLDEVEDIVVDYGYSISDVEHGNNVLTVYVVTRPY